MSKLDQSCVDKLNEISLGLLFPDAETRGSTFKCACPKCHASGKSKGKYIGASGKDTRKEKFIKCWSCGFGAGGGTINVMMKSFDMTYPDACQKLSDMSGIELKYEESPRRKKAEKKADLLKGSFVEKQLSDSGLTFEDVTATVISGDSEARMPTFIRGSIDILTGRQDDLADEMLILYFDLEGRRRYYVPAKNKSREMPYARVRWSNPEAHADREGKPVKYQSPYGAKSEFYIPQTIRSAYKSKEHIETLFIQEGEKKAEKACKHGIPSIAIQGIGNIGSEKSGLSDEMQYLVKTCSVKNIVFMMDSDWSNLSKSIHDDDAIDARPKAFYNAVSKFKRYIGSLKNSGIYVDIWFGHVNENEANDKGIDDILVNTLKGSEDELRKDIDFAMTATDGAAEYTSVINITTYSDAKLSKLWHLDNAQDFFEEHSEEIKHLKVFKFNNVFYNVADGKISVASDMGSGKNFWSTSVDDKGKRKLEIDLLNMLDFLNSNGFRTRKLEDGKRGFVKIDRGIIKVLDEHDCRRFVRNFVNRTTKDHFIQEGFLQVLDGKLSTNKLCQLEELTTAGVTPKREYQMFFFKNAEVTIHPDRIFSSELVGPVWASNLVKRDFERVKIFEYFRKLDDGNFEFELTEDGKDCEFLTYLLHTCDFWKNSEKTQKQCNEYANHVANKITAIGYLLRDYKIYSEAKAIVAMDAAMSQVGISNGRSGKSLIGMAISKFISQAYIGCKDLKNDDQYLFSSVTPQTKSIFMDDLRQDFDFGRFYPRITGNLNVNIKQGARYEIPFESAPKFYMTSNHALSGMDNSAKARCEYMSFSDWYNVEYSPKQEFGHDFFTEWNDRQWTLFDNLMCECVQTYMIAKAKEWEESGCGIVPPPMTDIRMRELRQFIKEDFLQWADLYFAKDGSHINCRISRKNMYDDYLKEYNIMGNRAVAIDFASRLKAYCSYAGLHYNAHRKSESGELFHEHFAKRPGDAFIGTPDKSNGIEYITINSLEYLVNQEMNYD